MEADYERYMRQCLGLAKIALAAGDPPVGAIVVLDGNVIGSGVESGRSTGDITNHAEILAVRDAIAKGHKDLLHQSVIYTTHEPCLMCSYLIRHHKIAAIIYGAPVPFVGGFTSTFKILSTDMVPSWGIAPKIIGGVCLEECNALSEQFRKRLHKS